MKLLIMILSSVILSGNANSQKVPDSAVPQKVIVAFNAKYKDAHIRNWKKGPEGIEVTFKINNKINCALYSTDGEWIKTERKIKWPKNLPELVRKALRSSEYAAWYVDEIKEVEAQGSRIYLVHVDNANVLAITDPYLFKDDYQLCFTEKGEIIRKEKLP
jgi:hypothetical protein